MKTIIILTFIMVFLLATSTVGFTKFRSVAVGPNANRLVIRVTGGGWGEGRVKDIQAVLDSVAAELLRYNPDMHLNPIIVEHGNNPKTLYRRGPYGEYVVQLSAGGTRWAQFAYQFSHELTHVLATREIKKENESPNAWFEESLCVAASLFTLRRMSETWRTSPPYSNWKSYAPALRDYADDEMNERERQLPTGMTLAEWYEENESNLRNEDVASSEARNKQFVVASKLLPIFEQNPDLWGSISYLNVRKTDSPHLQNYLNNWYVSAPDKHKRLIRDISYKFRE